MITATYRLRCKTMAEVNEMKLYNNMRTGALKDWQTVGFEDIVSCLYGQQQYTRLASRTTIRSVCHAQSAFRKTQILNGATMPSTTFHLSAARTEILFQRNLILKNAVLRALTGW